MKNEKQTGPMWRESYCEMEALPVKEKKDFTGLFVDDEEPSVCGMWRDSTGVSSHDSVLGSVQSNKSTGTVHGDECDL